MPRPRKTTNVTKKHLTKQEKKIRQEQEKKIKLDREELYEKVPALVKEDLLAYNEFIRIVNQAEKIDLWDNLDLSILTIYCKAYSNYIAVTEKIKEEGYVAETKDGYKISPYVTAQQKFIEQILKCSSKLGLATTDRLKLIVPEPEKKENKFAKYIK